MYQELQEVWQELTAKGAPFHISEIEVRGSPMRVFTEAPANLRDVWLASRAHSSRDYLVYEQERWTYDQAHQEVASIAAWLHEQGLRKGDRVAVAMRNYPEWMLCYWACVASGLAVVGMNAWWVEDEMAYGLEDSLPRVIFADEERLQRLANIKSRFPDLTVVAVRAEPPFEGALSYATVKAQAPALPEVSLDPDEDACIFYTSGTTGRPKGAQLTHRGCVHNILNMAFWGSALTLATCRAQGIEPPAPEDVPPPAGLVTTPLFHVTANNCLAHRTTVAGGKLVHTYRWDPGEALRLIEKEKINGITGVPVMARELISHPDFHKYDTSSLASVGGGGAQLQPDLVSKIDETVETARPGTGYGMTETCGIITSIGGDYFLDRPHSAGPAMPTFEVRIVDAEGNPQPQGETGELWVRGAPVIKGYLNRPEATAETITDGWLHTGDVARLDEHGFIYIVDRIKDMVLRGGENIYCSEVETVLHTLDGVAECSVFGVPDDRLGEEVGVAIYASAPLTAEGIRDHCRQHMAKHKIPRYVWILEAPLPRNANGKFLKRELRDTLDLATAS